MIDTVAGEIHIEYYFPKGYNPDVEPWKSIREHHNSELAWSQHLRIQLAAEVEKVNKLKGELALSEGNVIECHTVISRKNEEIDALWNTIRELTRRVGSNASIPKNDE